MSKLLLGIFLLGISIFMLIFGSGGLGGFIGVCFVIYLAIRLIKDALNKSNQDKETTRYGEECYARVLDCVPTGSFIAGKEEFKVIIVLYVSSLDKRFIQEEVVGYTTKNSYPKDSYLTKN